MNWVTALALLVLGFPLLNPLSYFLWAYFVAFGLYVVGNATISAKSKTLEIFLMPLYAYISILAACLISVLLSGLISAFVRITTRYNFLTGIMTGTIAITVMYVFVSKAIQEKRSLKVYAWHLLGIIPLSWIASIISVKVQHSMGLGYNVPWAFLTSYPYIDVWHKWHSPEFLKAIGLLFLCPLTHWLMVARFYVPSALRKQPTQDTLPVKEA